MACGKMTAGTARTNTEPAAAQEVIHFVGRVQGGPAFPARYAWSGSGFVAEFSGKGIVVRLRDDKNEHQVVLDGVATKKLVTTRDQERYVLAENLPAGKHHIGLFRRTEAMFGVTELLGVEVTDGQLMPQAVAKVRRIEVVGDSISCGYGNEGTTPDCPFSPETENHFESYGAIIARQFGAELSTVAWSGRGIVKNYAGGAGDYLGLLYDRILPEDPTSLVVAGPSADVVIVNVGTNDFSTDPDPEESHFVAEYAALLQKIRRNNPGALILCTVGPMLAGEDLDKAQGAIAKAVQLRNAAGDARVVAHAMKTANHNPGCDWHPSVGTHEAMASELSAALRANRVW